MARAEDTLRVKRDNVEVEVALSSTIRHIDKPPNTVEDHAALIGDIRDAIESLEADNATVET